MGTYSGSFTVTKLKRTRKNYDSWYSDNIASQGTYNGTTPKEYVGRIYFEIGSFNSEKYKITGVTMKVTREKSGDYGKSISLRLYAGAISASDLINGRSEDVDPYSAQKLADKTLLKTSNGATTFSLTADDLKKFNTYCIENKSYSLMVFSREGDLSGSSPEYTPFYAGLTKVEINYTYTEKAAIGTPADAILGESNSITFTALGSGFKYKALWTLGEKSFISTDFNTVTSGPTSLSYTIPASWGAQFPSSMSKVGTVALITYNSSGTEVGRQSYNITYSCPSSYVPTINISYNDTSGEPIYYSDSSLTKQVILQNLSKKDIKFTCSNLYGTSCRYSIKITNSNNVNLGSWSGTESSKTINSVTFSQSGTITIIAQVTDGRAKTNNKSITLSVTALPTFKKTPSIVRANEDGTEYVAGIYLKLIGTLSNVTDGIKLTVNPAFSDTTTSETIRKRGTTTSVTSHLSTKTISTDKKYNVTVTILSNKYYDKNGLISYNVSLSNSISSASYLLHFKDGGKAIGIGSAAGKDNTVSFGWKGVFNQGLELNSEFPLKITSGGTEASDRLGAWNNIVADGGTMTGNLIIGDSSNKLRALSVHGNLSVYLNPTINSTAGRLRFYDNDSTNSYRSADGNLTPAIVFGASLMSSDKSVRYNRFFFSQSSPSSENMNTPSTKDGNNIYEWYYFPDVTPGLTATKTYRILTTKDTFLDAGTFLPPFEVDSEGNQTTTRDSVQTQYHFYLGNILVQMGISKIFEVGPEKLVTGTIDFPISFSKSNQLFVMATKYHNSSDTNLDRIDVFPASKTQTTLTVNIANHSGALRKVRCSWIAIGNK